MFKNFISLYISTFHPFGLWKAGRWILIPIRHHFIHQDSRHPGVSLGDWHIFSAVIPVGSPLSVPASGGITLTADVVWQGQTMEFKRDSVRFHSHDLVYPATYPGESIDNTISIYPATYSPNGHITINGLPLALSPKKMAQSSCVATISRLKYWKMKIETRSPYINVDAHCK